METRQGPKKDGANRVGITSELTPHVRFSASSNEKLELADAAIIMARTFIGVDGIGSIRVNVDLPSHERAAIDFDSAREKAMRRTIRIVIGVVLTVVTASTASAAIQSGVKTGGTADGFTKLGPTLLGSCSNFFSPDRIESDNVRESGEFSRQLLGFDEQANVVLAGDLNVDVLSDGMGGEAGPGALAAGTLVCSHYIFFDPKDFAQAIFTITFDQEVAAIITSTENLFDSDFLGAPGITYNTSPGRPVGSPWLVTGLNTPTDSASITGTYTISVNLSRLSGSFLRVLTIRDDPIPEPTTLVVWSLLIAIGVGFSPRRKRRGDMNHFSSVGSRKMLTQAE